MRPIITLLFSLPLISGCSSGPIVKAQMDAEVKRLCAVDGGIKVYEAVKLPPDKFNKYGQINFYNPMQGENALGADYILKTNTHYYSGNNPTIYRYHIQVFLKSNLKLLGESVGYTRGGGDLPGPWQTSSFSCPEKYGEISLFQAIFINQN